jgi:hypothetical protein
VQIELTLPKLDGVGLLQVLLAAAVVEHVFIYTDQNDDGLLEWTRELGARDTLTTLDDVETLATRVRMEFADVANVAGVARLVICRPERSEGPARTLVLSS